MKYTTVILSLTFLVAFSACDRTKTCPAFDDSTLHKWFPYETGVTYNFVSSDGKQEMFTIEQEDYSLEHEIENPSWRKKYMCEINGERKTLIDSVMQQQIPIRLFHVVESEIDNINSSRPLAIHMTFRTMARPIYLTNNSNELTLASGNNSGYSIENFDVWNTNGRDYRNVADITIQGEEAEKIGMDKIYIAAGAGIVGYRTYPEGREYWQE